MKKVLALLMSLCMVLALVPACAEGENDAKGVWDIIEDAYIYAFPLVMTDATKIVATNTVKVENAHAPVNQLNHSKNLVKAGFKGVVTPNVDTVYTQAWLDLSEEPMIYVVPETDRFFKVQLLDAWTNTPAVLDQPGAYAITLPAWQGELPEGVTRVDIPTATAWSIARIVLSGEEDLPNVYAIQQEMQLMPLSAYVSGGEYTAPEGSYSQENEFVPVNKVLSMSPVDFFNRANELMLNNPPAEADAAMLERFAEINVGPGMKFDAAVLGEGAAESWKTMLSGLRPQLVAESANYTKKLGQWIYFGAPIGNFGTEYTYRAMVALAGLGANPVEVAIYPKTDTDETGAKLTGANAYVMHFDSVPPTLEGGFWSVTAYGSDDFLIDNPIDRYCINDRSDVIYNEDGSLDIVISKDQPDTPNWLPVSDGEFHIFMRIYTPDMDALDSWQPPVIRAQ